MSGKTALTVRARTGAPPNRTGELVVPPGGLVIRAPGVEMAMPALIADAGDAAALFTLEFFTARIPNRNTRAAYGRAIARFCEWCDMRPEHVPLHGLSSPTIAAYIEGLQTELSVASVKLQLAALRHWLKWLTQKGVLPFNPAESVLAPKLVVHEGKTPTFEREDGRKLFESIAGDDLLSKRDRAILGVAMFGWGRIGAIVKMRVCDFVDDGDRAKIVLREKGGKVRHIECHHVARDYLREYKAAAGFVEPRDKTPLFQSAPRRSGKLSGVGLDRREAWAMVKRRCAAAGLPVSICCHSFRASALTMHLESGGDIRAAQLIAGHADIRTTLLYDRRSRKVQRAEIERVQL